MPNWISVKEAAKIRKCTQANIRYLISQKKIEAKRDGGRWLVNDESLGSEKDFSQTADVISVLKAQLEEKDKQINLLQTQVQDMSERHDTIVMQMTRQMEQTQKMLESAKEPWYRRWRKKKENKRIN
jgi:excisionase family DNA binding protein